MSLKDKIESAKTLIAEHSADAALMCSFGKDSMVLLHLIRGDSLNEYPLPIIHHTHPWFPFKNDFANEIIKSWNLEIHDYPPLACGVKAKDDRIELVARYPFGIAAMDLPINTEPPVPRRPFACGLKWVLRPKIAGLQWLWKNVFIGHKSSDVDPYEGSVPLADYRTRIGEVNLIFPLRDWTDNDVWDYIEANQIPYDKRRYENRRELDDKWSNSDYLHACTACVDPREKARKVFCPKTGGMVENLGSRVLRFEGLPDYIVKEKAA